MLSGNACRSSPFFSAFQQGLVKDTDASAAIFAFTDAIPGAQVGRAVQDIDVAASALVSKVDLTLFPGISGTIITESSLTGVSFLLKKQRSLCRACSLEQFVSLNSKLAQDLSFEAQSLLFHAYLAGLVPHMPALPADVACLSDLLEAAGGTKIVGDLFLKQFHKKGGDTLFS
jgi:hypothetical protein